MKRLRDLFVRSVPCPECEAPSGHPCRDDYDRMTPAHQERWMLAAKKKIKKQAEAATSYAQDSTG